MLKSIGFVPVIDEIARETRNLYPAYMYGYMWIERNSYNQFDQPLDNIPERTNISRTTVRKWVKWLCDKDYIKDLTPDLHNQPHTYQLTDKIKLDSRVTIEIAPTNPRASAVRQTNGTPFAKRTAVQASAVRETDPMYHDHDMMHVSELQTVTDLWAQLGFDSRGLPKMLAAWSADIEIGAAESLARCLKMWLEATEAGNIPDEWGHGLIYQKVKDGEAPPAKKATFADEVRALMEYQAGTRSE